MTNLFQALVRTNLQKELYTTEFSKADGASFWSYNVDVSQLEDGEHTIYVKGYDPNGKESLVQSVVFHLDTAKPVNVITSHESGVLVSGKVGFEGTVKDLNGINEFYISRDGGRTWDRSRISHDKAQNIYNFKTRVNTKKMKDGPAVLWFKSVDKTGSVGLSSFLFFVDNKGPELEIISHKDGDVVNGSFLVTGRVSDEIGLGRLSWSMGKNASGEIKIIPGNPWFVQEFDVTQERGRSAVVEFAIEDTAGNASSTKVKLSIDRDADVPRAVISHPEEGTVLQNGINLAGTAFDDDGIKAVKYSVDGGGWVEIKAGRGFGFNIPDLDPGEHSIAVIPVDLNGLEGEETSVSFVVEYTEPLVFMENMIIDKEPEPFTLGMTVTTTQKSRVSLEGTAETSMRLRRGEYEIPEVGETGKISVKSVRDLEAYSLEMRLPRNLPSGRVTILYSLYDDQDTEYSFRSMFFNNEGTVETDLILVDPRAEDISSIKLKKGYPLRAFYSGAAITRAQLSPVVPEISLTHGENLIIIEATGQTISENVSIIVEDADGNTNTYEGYSFFTDFTGPDIKVFSPSFGSWNADECRIAGILEDGTGITSLEYAVGQGEPFTEIDFSSNRSTIDTELENPVDTLNALPADGDVGDASSDDAGTIPAYFSQKISLKSAAEGTIELIFRITDEAGNQTRKVVIVNKDTQAPEPELLVPGIDDKIDGRITVVGNVSDDGRIEKVEFSADGDIWIEVSGTDTFHHVVDFSSYEPVPEVFYFRGTDLSGNTGVLEASFTVDAEGDKPVAEIQIPEDGAVLRNDFIISGMAFDDDRVGSIFWRIDDNEYQEVQDSNNLGIAVSIDDITDNEHTIEMYARDINGLSGDVVKSTFKVSREEPVAALITPDISTTVNDIVTLTGEASDKNGIREVHLSFDNGNTYYKTQGSEDWNYILDTKIFEDGVYSVIIKAIDTYGTEGFYTTLMNIDNTNPVIELDTPADGKKVTGTLILDGRVSDTIHVEKIRVELTGIKDPGNDRLEISPEPSSILYEVIDVSELAPAEYNLQITAIDRAENTTILSRNIFIEEKKEADTIEVVYPADGQPVHGKFVFSGHIDSSNTIDTVELLIDGEIFETLDVNDYGYFSQLVGAEELDDGTHTLVVRTAGSTAEIASIPRTIEYKRQGGWVTANSVTVGDFIRERPWIRGEAGYYLPPVGPAAEEGEDTVEEGENAVEEGENAVEEGEDAVEEVPAAMDPEERKLLERGSRVSRVEISFDNGKSFVRAGGRNKWRYRLQTQDIPDGELYMIIKATFRNGETAFQKLILNVDETKPQVNLLSPKEGARFNDDIHLVGTADDKNGLRSVEVKLRPGDKNNYKVPEFIQGSFVDIQGFGATYLNAGMGLSFFDNNVKLQILAGLAPPGRFEGYVVGAKLIANVAQFPFEYFFGPDWEFFSMSVGVGANFSYFTMSDDPNIVNSFSAGEGLVLGAVLLQYEFARISFDTSVFKSISLYYEPQLWFISSDVSGGVVFNYLSGGIRFGLF